MLKQQQHHQQQQHRSSSRSSFVILLCALTLGIVCHKWVIRPLLRDVTLPTLLDDVVPSSSSSSRLWQFSSSVSLKRDGGSFKAMIGTIETNHPNTNAATASDHGHRRLNLEQQMNKETFILENHNHQANMKTLGIHQNDNGNNIRTNDKMKTATLTNKRSNICYMVSSLLDKYIKGMNRNDHPNSIMVWHPTFLWNYLAASILEASIVDHPNDHDFASDVMTYITPEKLAASRKTLPHGHWEQIDRIMNVIYERYAYIQNAVVMNKAWSHAIPKKLTIVVFSEFGNQEENCRIQECTWPRRYERFLNKLLLDAIIPLTGNQRMPGRNIDSDIVKVYYVPIAQGTNEATHLLQSSSSSSSLLPSDDPDIIINALAKNDMSSLVNESNTTIREENLLQLLQHFIHATSQKYDRYDPNDCSDKKTRRRPLLLFYNDILDVEYQYVLNTVSNYYGIGLISYHDTVIDYVLPSIHETWFSTQVSSDDDATNTHYGPAMHMTSMWIMAFNMLDYGMTYCSTHGNNNNNNIGDDDYQSQIQSLLRNNDDLTTHYTYMDLPPKDRPWILPPILDIYMESHNISTLWSRTIKEKCS